MELLASSMANLVLARERTQGELEEIIAEAWKHVFCLDEIGHDENFFGLGGNSLLGMALTERLASKMGLQIPVVVLFQYPTVRELARAIASDESVNTSG